MKKHLIALAAIAATLAAPLAQAQDTGSWIVRAHALHLDSANKGVAGLEINNKTFPEFDISYFFSPNLAAELVLTYPQKQDVIYNGGKIGTLKHLPPTLSLQYHFTGIEGFRPYVGAGVNYTRFSNVNTTPAATVDKNSFGLSVGAGADILLGGGWLLNVDVKKVQIRTDVNVPALGGDVGKFKVDPLLIGVGVGYRF